MNPSCRCANCITPPHLLRKLLENKDRDIRDAAMATLLGTYRLSGQRSIRSAFGIGVSEAPSDGRRTIFDCRESVRLSEAALVRTEQGQATADASVERAFDGFGKTRDFFKENFDRNSIDDRGMRLDGYVHRGFRYNNAFWDGQQMVFGDGDGVLFTDFTSSLDVIAHELTHGVTEHTAGLEYHLESGALNESVSDIFGSMVKQWALQQRADQADWLIGTEVFTPAIDVDALRSMKAPGTAYDNADLGKDPQPDHMKKFVRLPDTEDGDFGGVHINSGIPNKAFYLLATNLGGYSWEVAGVIWYQSLLASSRNTQFEEFATTTFSKAGEQFGNGGVEQKAVLDAWRQVGVRVGTPMIRSESAFAARAAAAPGEDLLASLSRQLEKLSDQVNAMSKDLNALKKK